MTFARVCRVAVVAAATLGLSGVGVVAADAVQTAKFGLAATGARSKIVHPASDATIHDAVIVYNRTASALTVTLDVVGVTQKPDGSYSLGASGTGLARDVELQTRSVTLPGKGRKTVAITIQPVDNVDAPEFAAVTAVAGPASSPGVSVTERLAVLVGLTPPAHGSEASRSGGGSHRSLVVVVAAVLLLAILALLVAAFALRRRRSAARP